MKEEDLSELMEELMEAEHLISTYVVGLPQQEGVAGANALRGDSSIAERRIVIVSWVWSLWAIQ